MSLAARAAVAPSSRPCAPPTACCSSCTASSAWHTTRASWPRSLARRPAIGGTRRYPSNCPQHDLLRAQRPGNSWSLRTGRNQRRRRGSDCCLMGATHARCVRAPARRRPSSRPNPTCRFRISSWSCCAGPLLPAVGARVSPTAVADHPIHDIGGGQARRSESPSLDAAAALRLARLTVGVVRGGRLARLVQ
jgi:hypothetical protein